jgi:hypothetical protein
MTIARELQRYRFQYVSISASNVLDEIFLAQFLHRACPDVRLVFYGADLLMVREIDNLPFLGWITITPYPLIGLGTATRAHPDSTSEAYYNAVSYTFWQSIDAHRTAKPHLDGYHSLLDPDDIQRPALWATVIGRDGYYPLAMLNPVATDDPHVLPTIGDRTVTAEESRAAQRAALAKITFYPSRSWIVIAALVCFL